MNVFLSSFEFDKNFDGGAATYAINVAASISEKHNVYVQTCQGEKEEIKKDFKVTYKDTPTILKNRGFLKYLWYIATLRVPKADLWIANTYEFAFKKSSAKKICIVHHAVSSDIASASTYIVNKILGVLEKRAIKKAHKVVCVSQQTLDQITKRYNPKKISLIPTGVDTNHFKPSKKKKNQILCIPRGYIHRKGADIAIKSFALIHKKLPKIKLIMLGEGNSKPIKELVVKYKLKKNVVFINTIPYKDLPKLISQSKLTLIPSRLEGFSLCCLESLACKTPVIGTKTGAIPQLVKGSGYAVPIDDEVKLANKAVELLCDQKKYVQFKEQARKNVLKYSWRKVAQNLLA